MRNPTINTPQNHPITQLFAPHSSIHGHDCIQHGLDVKLVSVPFTYPSIHTFIHTHPSIHTFIHPLVFPAPYAEPLRSPRRSSTSEDCCEGRARSSQNCWEATPRESRRPHPLTHPPTLPSPKAGSERRSIMHNWVQEGRTRGG